jgi:hypothetical protein
MSIQNKDLFRQVGLAEGFVEGSEQEKIDAWQWLLDTGHVWGLQGWFGRTAVDLLARGVIEDRRNTK